MQLLTFLTAAAALMPGTVAYEFDGAECNARFPIFEDWKDEYRSAIRFADLVGSLMDAEATGPEKITVAGGPGKCLALVDDDAEIKRKDIRGNAFICNDNVDTLTLSWGDYWDAHGKILDDCMPEIQAGKSSYQVFTKNSEKKWNMIIRGV